ncbi:hypothetical protein KC345_g9365 [Hortaea werneckii]|nr:hypothetical protein KC345_g9365 [Hortaea werneckii]
MFICMCSLSLTAGVSAGAYKELPAPVWTTPAPDGVEDLRVMNNLIYAMSYDYTTVYNDRTGSKSATLTYPSNILSSSFNLADTIIDKQGIFYRIVTTMDKTTRQSTYYLKAYSPSGAAIWTKTFPEKVPSFDVRIFAQKDGNVLAVLKTNNNQYMTYKFNRQGKQLQKKQINGYIDSYYFDTLATLSHQSYASGQFRVTVSIYDSALAFKSEQQITDEQFYCMLPDGTLIFMKSSKENSKKTTVTARNQSGATLWSKVFTSGNIHWFSTRSTQPYPYGFLLQTDTMLYLLGSKGLVSQLPVNSGSAVQIGSDSNLMIQGPRNLTIVQGSDLSVLHTVNLPDADKKFRNYFYAGKGILYQSETSGSEDGLLYKYELH